MVYHGKVLIENGEDSYVLQVYSESSNGDILVAKPNPGKLREPKEEEIDQSNHRLENDDYVI